MIDTWIFDLDDTLYPPQAGLLAQVNARITDAVAQAAGVGTDDADSLRTKYWQGHGTTLAGLMAHHAVDPARFLAEVHDIDISAVQPDPALNAQIAALRGRRIVHTNAQGDYARRVLARLGLEGAFDAIWAIEDTGLIPKPDPRAFAALRDNIGYDPRRAAMFEDTPRNLDIPKTWGMTTVLIAPDDVEGTADLRGPTLLPLLERLAQGHADMAQSPQNEGG